MRLAVALVFVLAPGAHAASECRIVWPNANIPIPAEVSAFIDSECWASRMSDGEEDIASCKQREAYGYRAVIQMLTDPVTGDRAAELYRTCRVGLGTQGGRFHRRRAECIGSSLGYVWRFEFTLRASVETYGAPEYFATNSAANQPTPQPPQFEELRLR